MASASNNSTSLPPTDTSSSISSTSQTSLSSSTTPPPPPPTSSSSISSSVTSSSSTTSASNSDSSSANSTSATSSSTSSSTSVLTTPSTSVFSSTALVTSNGQTFTSIERLTTTLPAGSTITSGSDSSSNHHSSSHTGAIVGGVVGGIAGLAILALLVFFFCRRKSSDKDFFDGNFDPDRVVRPDGTTTLGGATLPNVGPQDAEEEDDGMGGRLVGSSLGAGVVTPFTYSPPQQQQQYYSDPHPPASPPMSQYSTSGASTATSSVPYALQPGGAHYPYQGPYNNMMMPVPAPAPSVSSGSSYPTSNPRSAKEREAGIAGHAMGVANPDEGGSGVVVHRDAGRVVEERDEGAREIPPTYDSVPRE